jgi:SAM-dependent methyltransferase
VRWLLDGTPPGPTTLNVRVADSGPLGKVSVWDESIELAVREAGNRIGTTTIYPQPTLTVGDRTPGYELQLSSSQPNPGAVLLQASPAPLEAVNVTGVSAPHVTFVAGDVQTAAIEPDFDAIVARWVLMYLANPVAVLRWLATRLRPGGVMAFHENDFTYPPTTFPPSELSQQVQRWSIPRGNVPGGPDMRMGTPLFHLFLDAGLPTPELRLEAPIGGGPNWPGYEYIAETLRSLLPTLEQLAGLHTASVEIGTLADRLRDDTVASRGVQMLPIMIGAWARKPA